MRRSFVRLLFYFRFLFFFPLPRSVANYIEGDRILFRKIERLMHLNLSSLRVCFRVKSTKNRNTVLSYLVTRETKKLELEIYDRDYLTRTMGGEKAR